MPYERNYYVICDDNCKFPAMTAEQVLAAIAEATGSTPTHVDDAFITKIREQNANNDLKFWVGTQAQYNALTPEGNTFYIITDSTDALTGLQNQIDENTNNISIIDGGLNAHISEIDAQQGEITIEKIGNTTRQTLTLNFNAGYKFYVQKGTMYGEFALIPNGNNPYIEEISKTVNFNIELDIEFSNEDLKYIISWNSTDTVARTWRWGIRRIF